MSTCGAAFEEMLLLRLRSIRRTVLREARCSASHSATDPTAIVSVCARFDGDGSLRDARELHSIRALPLTLTGVRSSTSTCAFTPQRPSAYSSKSFAYTLKRGAPLSAGHAAKAARGWRPYRPSKLPRLYSLR